MKHNYPIKQKNQPEHPEFIYQDYAVTSDEMATVTTSDDSSVDVEIEMSRGVYDMRREFRIRLKKLRRLYADKKPKTAAYISEYETPRRIPLSHEQVIG